VREWFHAFLNLAVEGGLYHISYDIITFISIPWIVTGLQNPYGYGNSHICLRSQEVKAG
jgi:hypothetical protein